MELPAATVRGWLRAARAGARWLATTAMAWAHRLVPDPGRLRPAGTPLADAVAALAVAVAAARRRLGPIGTPWTVIGALTGGRLLAAPAG